MGIINVGGKGTVSADGETYPLDYKEALYLGRGIKEVHFSSENSNTPAKFYLNSAPAHYAYPTQKVGRDQAEIVELGSAETSNARTIRKLIVNSIVKSCQLQMGMTEFSSGSVWNTMPAHVHDRRMEVYFYFEVPRIKLYVILWELPMKPASLDGQRTSCHFTPWSIHAGSGTLIILLYGEWPEKI